MTLDIGVYGARGIPSTYSGFETFLTELLPTLAARGHRVTMYCRRGEVPPVEDGKGLHVYHQYTIRTAKRDVVRSALATVGIASAVYYPVPLHRQEVYAADNAGACFPAAEAAAEQVLSLPMYPELTEEQVDEIVRAVRQARA